jgi:ribonuclease R
VLRSQSQAVYSPDNLGHFGLALQRYCHFTSPIRRYSDLIVHRGLIQTFGLGEGGETYESNEDLVAIAEHVSFTERRSADAERDAVDRYTTTYLADRVGADFEASVSGVTRFGLFVTLKDTGADGLVPISSLPEDYYRHDEAMHRLIGDYEGRVYNLGDHFTVRLVEATPVTGGMLFEIQDNPKGNGRSKRVRGRPKHKGRPRKQRR